MAPATVLEQCTVSPMPGPAAGPRSLPLTFFDLVWLYSVPVQRLFLYSLPHPTSVLIESYVPRLKSSLSLTLSHFYPLAGKLRRSPDSIDHRYELHYADGDSVPFTVAETDLDFAHLTGRHARDYAQVRSLVPTLSESEDFEKRPLLAIQVTLFPNRGIGIGYVIDHVVCDGFSITHFLRSWASSCRSGGLVDPPVEPSPCFDRSAIVDPCELYAEYVGDVLSFVASKPALPAPATTCSELVTATFALGPDRIGKLKASVPNCSTFVVSCAYLWVSLVKTRGYPADQMAYFIFSVDWRKRLEPPPPAAYFGNCVGICAAIAKAGDLVKDDGVVAASEAIRRSIQGLKAGVAKNMSGLVRICLTGGSNNPLTVAGSPQFKVYDIDFGWGRPQKVDVPSVKTGAIWLSESGEEQGGVEIGVVLSKDEMETFMVHFG